MKELSGMRILWTIAATVLLLAGCTGDWARSIGAGFESWCRNSPDHCSVSAERR